MATQFCPHCNREVDTEDRDHWRLKRGKYLECKAHSKLTRQQVRKEKNLEKWGTETPRDSADYHKKIDEKRQATIMAKYGVKSAMHLPEVKQKLRQSVKAKYGVEHPAQAAAVKQKTKDTNQAKYGVTCTLRHDAVQAKSQATCLRKYGVTHAMKSKDVQGKAHRAFTKVLLSDGTRLSEFCTKNNIPISSGFRVFAALGESIFLDYVKDYRKHVTSLESAFMSLMRPELSLDLYNRKPPGVVPFIKPDFQLNDKIYINVDGLWWHSDQQAHHGKEGYHQYLRTTMESAGLRLIQFRQDDVVLRGAIVKSIVMNLTGGSQKMNAREGVVERIHAQDAKDFFVKNHLMGNHGASKAYGLRIRGELVACMSVRQTGDIVEIARFCNRLGSTVRGAFGKLLARVEKDLAPREIHSFCDLRYATGASYERNGFCRQYVTQGWCWTDGRFTYNRLQCRANMDERRMSESDHAKEMGWYKIFDAGQAKYVKTVSPSS